MSMPPEAMAQIQQMLQNGAPDGEMPPGMEGGGEQMPPMEGQPPADAMLEEGGMPPEEGGMPTEGMPEEQMGMEQDGMGEEMPPEGFNGVESGVHPHGDDEFLTKEMEEYQADPIDPIEMLPETILEYMDFLFGVKADKELGYPVKSKILLDGAQALSYLLPLLPSSQNAQAQADMQMKEMEMQIKQQEFEMKQQEQEAALEMKREEFELNQQMKQAEMEFKQTMNQVEYQHKLQTNQQELQVKEVKNQQDIVHKEKDQQIKAQQAKQAAQSKPTSKQGSNNSK